MQSIGISYVEPDESKYNFAIKMHNEGLLPGPISCKCNTKIFYIQHDKSSITSGISFRCSNN